MSTRRLGGPAVPPHRRLGLSIALGCFAGLITAFKNAQLPYPRDFGQVWFAARAILRGVNPYPLIGPGLAFDWKYPLLYPIPAALVAVPVAPFSVGTASVLFVVVGAACFAWALMEYGYGPVFGFFSDALHHAAHVGQWSPLFASSLVLPGIGFLFLAKPTIGAAMFIARPSRWAIVGGIVLAVISFAVQPTWIQDWLSAVHANSLAWAPVRPYVIPALLPGGVLALLALLRWRRPEARLIAALACVPQTPAMYEVVPLFLVPRTFWEAAVLVGLTYAERVTINVLLPESPSLGEYLPLEAQLLTLLLYLPATLMVLRRPNEGTIPMCLERRLAGWRRRKVHGCDQLSW